jgi:hypothetical protein
MNYYDVMCYGKEDLSREDFIIEAMTEEEYDAYVDEMAAEYEAELAYEGGYCG